MKSLFITFEGIEGCGKSTQAKLLTEYLKEQGKNVLLTREPGGPKISEDIRNVLLSTNNKEMIARTEILLYMASRSQHTGEWIIPNLEQGNFVISDRYFDSTIAYQGAARKIPRNIIDTLTNFATFGLRPDVTFLVDLPAEIGLSRIETKNADRLEQESLAFHKEVRKGFLDLAKQESDRFVILHGKKSIAEIQKDIIEVINKFIR
ncbi:MAG: dTMP kinase [Candidatus Cloacimonetes bacterium]|nr:dTMP kinase [Candidatus Cloacimonadota bacterium]MCF7814464.1 dTMP kinase [Candidatus Cloacimonadota bacterium]MCF7869039.1 dTMP kinase [Candidatus Cloacimonadota bacterium]MCF7884434.1 dTMP kinase [Candidatus Cloacimonadota bacterium]